MSAESMDVQSNSSDEPGLHIFVGRDLPIEGDILFASTDSVGTPGDLNSRVLKYAGYPVDTLQRHPELRSHGYAEIRPTIRPIVIAIVTIAPSSKTSTSLENNLSRALAELRWPPSSPKARIWLPLMGVGAGKLERQESFKITALALERNLSHLSQFVSDIYLSCDEKTPTEQLESFVASIKAMLADFTAKRTDNKSAADNASAAGSKPSDREVKDNIPTYGDGAERKPGMGFSDIAAGIVTIVQSISDAQGTEDEGKRSRLANLREARVTIGIFAPWGAGKTTLIRELRRRFHAAGHLVVMVNPWRWDGKGDLHDYVQSQVIDEFASSRKVFRLTLFKLKRWFRRYKALIWIGTILIAVAVVVAPILGRITENNNPLSWTDLLTKLGWSSLIPLGAVVAPILPTLYNWLTSALGNVAAKKDREFGAAGLSLAYRDIAKLLSQEDHQSRPFVFFFDDLDRCSPERVAMVLESVHSLTAAGCVVFISCDDEYVVAAINAQYEKIANSYTSGPTFGRRFLEKIVQISFRLPLIRTEDVLQLGFVTQAAMETKRDTKELLREDAGTQGDYRIRRMSSSPVETNLTARRARHQPENEIQLGVIIGELLKEAVEPLGLNIRQVKSITNTLKLYLGITGTANEQQARCLAAFVFADRLDPIWLDAVFFGKKRSTTAIGAVEKLDQSLISMIGENKDQMLTLYHLLGRRPRPLVEAEQQPAIAKSA